MTAAVNSKTYDGTTSAAATPTITAGSLQSGDTATACTETYADRNVGTGKTLTPAGRCIDGNSGLNYSYAYTAVTTGVIAQTNLTVTAAANSKTYDGTTSAAATPTITAGSLQSGDTADRLRRKPTPTGRPARARPSRRRDRCSTATAG